MAKYPNLRPRPASPTAVEASLRKLATSRAAPEPSSAESDIDSALYALAFGDESDSGSHASRQTSSRRSSVSALSLKAPRTSQTPPSDVVSVDIELTVAQQAAPSHKEIARRAVPSKKLRPRKTAPRRSKLRADTTQPANVPSVPAARAPAPPPRRRISIKELRLEGHSDDCILDCLEQGDRIRPSLRSKNPYKIIYPISLNVRVVLGSTKMTMTTRRPARLPVRTIRPQS